MPVHRSGLRAPILLGLALLAALGASAAVAQNPVQVRRAQAGASCPRCNLFQADFADRALSGRDFTGARLRQADASAAVMTGARLAHADLRDLNGYGVLLGRADLRGADLANASLVGAYLQGADLAGAKLTGVNLSGAEASRARGLTRAQLAGACGDEATTLPPGLHVAACR